MVAAFYDIVVFRRDKKYFEQTVNLINIQTVI